MTWNQARDDHALRLEELFPDIDSYHIVAFGVEEATSSEKKAQADLIHDYLGAKEWEIVGNAGKGQINLCVF